MKKYFLGLVAVVLALGLSAFTAKTNTNSFAIKYFKYLDYPNDMNKNNPARYELSPDLGCTTGLHRCAVVATSDGGVPERPILNGSEVIKNKN